MTIGEYINESKSFETSDEYYDLISDCLRLQLESINLLRESNNDILGTDVTFFERIEAYEVKETIKEKTSEAAAKLNKLRVSVSTRIKELASKALHALKTFWDRITGKSTKDLETLQQTCDELQETVNKLKSEKAEIEYKNDTLIMELEDAHGEVRQMSIKLDTETKELLSKLAEYEKNLNRANKKVSDLNKQIASMVISNETNLQTFKRALDAISKLASEDIELTVSEVTAKADQYIEMFRKVITYGGDDASFVGVRFGRLVQHLGASSVEETITNINTAKREIEKARNRTVNATLNSKWLALVHDKINNALPAVHKMAVHDKEDEKHFNDEYKEIIEEHSVLFGKYTQALADFSSAFRMASSVIIYETKDFMDAKQQALQLESRLKMIFDKFSKETQKWKNKLEEEE